MLRNVTVSSNIGTSSNPGNGVMASGGAAVIWITKSTISFNATGLATASGGTIVSFGDNSLASNTTDGAPTSTMELQ